MKRAPYVWLVKEIPAKVRRRLRPGRKCSEANVVAGGLWKLLWQRSSWSTREPRNDGVDAITRWQSSAKQVLEGSILPLIRNFVRGGGCGGL